MTEAAQQERPLHGLFLDHLREATYAEHRILKALPRLAEVACDAGLQGVLTARQADTEAQTARLEAVFATLDLRPQARPSVALDGILASADTAMTQLRDSPALDAAVAAATQAITHHEIASYGMLVTWARQLGHDEAAALLQSSLDEERAAASAGGAAASARPDDPPASARECAVAGNGWQPRGFW